MFSICHMTSVYHLGKDSYDLTGKSPSPLVATLASFRTISTLPPWSWR